MYWYNGLIVSSEINRGLDIFELQPSAFLTQNELDAAKTVQMTFLNAQEQPKFVWPALFAKSRAFADQLERTGGLSSSRITAVRESLSGAERASGSARSDALKALATQLDGDAKGSADSGRVIMLAASVRELAK